MGGVLFDANLGAEALATPFLRHLSPSAVYSDRRHSTGVNLSIHAKAFQCILYLLRFEPYLRSDL